MTEPPTDLTPELAARARRAGHRLALVLAGSEAWTAETALDLERSLTKSGRPSVIRLSDRAGIADAIPLRKGTGLIGSECDLLIYDAWSGLDPDALGAVSGTIRAGGLLMLLTPALGEWHRLPDPQAARIAVWPHPPESVSGRFIRRLAGIIGSDRAVALIEEGRPSRRIEPAQEAPLAITEPLAPRDPARPATADQALAVAAIIRLAAGRPHRPLVITADRGRGKSAALGLAAASVLSQGIGPVLVTAPRRGACEPLFRHAALAGSQVHLQGPGCDNGKQTLTFHPPDALIEAHPPARLLLVDEAAGIPAPMLARLLSHYGRVVFATTVHGYEGTGRGFDCRFRSHLDAHTPLWRRLTMRVPIRWRDDDPLEAFTARALLLDAGPAEGEPPDRLTGLEHRRLDRDALADDETTLSQVFGLLVLAHYQTRPMDLRMLLDGPNLRVHVLMDGRLVVATLLAAEEGAITDEPLRRAIYEGRRRPRGHLIPQTLSAHAGLPEAPSLSCLRVVRIAVHPALGRRGLGRRMIEALCRAARTEGIDLVGASFGASAGLMAFWSACGLQPAQIGSRRNASSGEHALVMLRPLNGPGRELLTHAQTRLERRLDILLAGPLRRIDAVLAASLTANLGAARADETIPEDDWLELGAFATGRRPLESALPALAALARLRLGPAIRRGALALDDAALVIAATRQLRPLTELASETGMPGREAVLERLRRLIGRLLADAPRR